TPQGLAKVIPQERRTIPCSTVDVEAPDAATWSDAEALDALCAELRVKEPGTVVALRRGQRFIQGYEPLTLAAPEKLPRRVREGGVYLITGGLGGATLRPGAPP